MYIWKAKSNIVTAINTILTAINPETGLPYIDKELTELQMRSFNDVFDVASVFLTFADASIIEATLLGNPWERTGNSVTATGSINSAFYVFPPNNSSYYLTYGILAPTMIAPATTRSQLEATLIDAWGVPALTIITQSGGEDLTLGYNVRFNSVSDDLQISNGSISYDIRASSTFIEFYIAEGILQVHIQADAMVGFYSELTDAYINTGSHQYTPINGAFAELTAIDLTEEEVTAVDDKYLIDVAADPTIVSVTINTLDVPQGSVVRNTLSSQKFFKDYGHNMNYVQIPIVPMLDWNLGDAANTAWEILQAK